MKGHHKTVDTQGSSPRDGRQRKLSSTASDAEEDFRGRGAAKSRQDPLEQGPVHVWGVESDPSNVTQETIPNTATSDMKHAAGWKAGRIDDQDLQHLAAIVRDSGDAIIGTTRVGTITSWNSGAEQIYGYTAQEAIGRSVSMLVPPDREDELPKILHRITQGEGTIHYDTLRATKDGRLVNISFTVSPIHDGSGALVGISSIGRDVTKEKEAEDALRESAKAYKLLMEQSSDAILVSYPGQPLIEVNQRVSDMLGYSREELLQLSGESSSLPEGLSALPLRFDEIPEGDIVQTERPVRRKDGTEVVIELSARRLDDGRILTIARDITERKLAEKLLRERTEQLAVAQRLSRLGSWELDIPNRKFSWSEEMRRIFGIDLQQAGTSHQAYLKRTHPDDANQIREDFKKAFREKTSIDRTYRFIRSDGGVGHFHARTEIVLDQAGRLLKIWGTAQDVTESREADDALLKSESNYRFLIEHMSEGLLQVDTDDIIQFVNDRYCEMVGYTRDELMGKVSREMVVVEEDHPIIAEKSRLRTQHISDRYEVRLRKKSGDVLWVQIGGAPVEDEMGNVVGSIGIHSDVTARKLAEEAMQKSEERFQLVARATHDVIWDRNLVTGEMWISKDSALQITDKVPTEGDNSTYDAWYARIHPDDREAVTSSLAAVLKKGGSNLSNEYRLLNDDGSYSHVLDRGYFIRNNKGQAVRMIGSLMDITERKLFEEALQQSEERARSQYKGNPTPIYTWLRIGDEFVLSDFNQAADEITSGATRTLLGKTATDMYCDMPQLIEDFERCYREQTIIKREMEYKFISVDKTRHLVFSCVFVAPDIVMVHTEDITDRRQIEETRSRLASIVETSSDAIIATTLEGIITDWNKGAQQIYGYSVEEIVGKHLSVLVPADRLLEVVEQSEQIRKGIGIQQFETVRIDKWGKPMNVSLSTAALRDSNGLIIGESAIIRDITASKQAEEKLRVQAEVLDQVRAAVTIINMDGIIRYWNSHAEEIYGWSRDEALGRNARELIVGPADHDLGSLIMVGIMESGSWEGEFTVQRKDGTSFPAHVVDTIMRNADGEPIGVVGISVDVSERKYEEEALRTSEQRFRAIFESSSDVIAIIDNQGRIVDVNPAIEQLLGVPKQDVIGRLIFSIFQADAQNARQSWEESLLAGEATAEYQVTRPNGEVRDIEYHLKADFTPGYHLAVAGDITDQKHAARVRLAMEAASKASTAKSEFLSRMSHELRTPLNAILGFGELLQIDGPAPGQKESVDYIIKAGKHLLTLINEVLDIARIEEGHLSLSCEPVLVEDILRESIDLIKPIADRRNINLTIAIAAKCPQYVMADRQRIRQVLLNLLSNAVKYSHEEGEVALSCEPVVDNRIRIVVRDEGPGIPEQDLPKLFMPFERLDAGRTEIEGSGLGLALSKKLIDAMGGAIGVESSPGTGSTFWVELVITDGYLQHTQHPLTSPQNPADHAKPARTVLYVEDNISNLRLMETIMKYRPNITLIPAMRGDTGLALAKDHRPDLILLDLNLPNMSGETVLDKLRGDPSTAGIPVVIVSADATPPQVERLLAAGAAAYITKPINVRRFLEVLDASLLYEQDSSPRC